MKSLFWTSRHAFSLLMGALILVKSMFWTSMHEFCFPYGGCSHLSEVDVVDLEANLFLTVLSFEKNRCF